MKIRIAHLSDPHFGTISEGVEEALLSTLIALKPDLVLISGDITQRARAAQFKAARAFKEKLLPIPSFAVPGNHDIPLFNVFGRFFRPYHGFHKYFQSRREADLKVGTVRVIGLNSTSRWRHIQGSLNVERIRPILESEWGDTNFRVAVVHHPIECKKTIDDKNLIKGRDEVMKLFRENKIDLVLSGHVHDPFVTINNSMILSVAGTCLSWRTREDAPNSFHLIEFENEAVSLTRMDIVDKNRYEPKGSANRFERTPEGWRPSA